MVAWHGAFRQHRHPAQPVEKGQVGMIALPVYRPIGDHKQKRRQAKSTDLVRRADAMIEMGQRMNGNHLNTRYSRYAVFFTGINTLVFRAPGK